MNEIAIKHFILYTIVAYVIVVFFRKKDFNLLHVFVFLLPFKALMFEVGLQLMGYQIPLLVAFFLEFSVNKSRSLVINRSWFVFIVYLILSTVIISLFFIPDFQPNVHNTFFRTEGRFIAVLIKIVVLQSGIFWLFSSLVGSKKEIFALLKTYITALKILVSIGLLQFLIYIPTGINITPIGVRGDGRMRHALSDMIITNLGVPRVCSLGGEPKGLAASICVGIMILTVSRKYGIIMTKNISFWLVTFLVTLFLTLSTGGYGLLIIFYLTYLLIILLRGDLKISNNLKTTSLILLAFGLVVFYFDKISRIVTSRIVKRADRLLNEDIDAAIQSFMLDQPNWLIFGSGSGNIHNLAYDYIENSWLQVMMNNQIFISRYGYIRLLSENGIIGLLLFTTFIILIVLKSFRSRKISYLSNIFFILSIISVLFYFARSRYVEAEMYFILGLSAAWNRLLNKSE